MGVTHGFSIKAERISGLPIASVTHYTSRHDVMLAYSRTDLTFKVYHPFWDVLPGVLCEMKERGPGAFVVLPGGHA